MPNGGKYIICTKIAEGGLSLIYSAQTQTNGYPVIIKEFFPSEHARRATVTLKQSDGSIVERKGRIYPEDSKHNDRFNQCRKAFEQEGQIGNAARLNNFQIVAFSDCDGENGYAVLPRWSNDMVSFQELVNSWLRCPPNKIDPMFTELSRVRFALLAIRSLLTVLCSLHKQNLLHLDLSPSNVLWAGSSRTSPENGVTILTDFGCSVLMAEGGYPAEYVLSYSKEFAAPEFTIKDSHLDYTTDIFSVGKLLLFLCRGRRALDLHTTPASEIHRLNISKRHQSLLLSIVQKATEHEMRNRYQSAEEMLCAVNDLLEAIPLHPINDDNEKAFTLYSLKSMLEGSLATRYSWAHELMDRRGIIMDVLELVYQPVADLPNGRFENNEAFLCAILPKRVFDYLQERFAEEEDKQFAINAVISCNYSREWRDKIRGYLSETNYVLPELVAKCKGLLNHENIFRQNITLLFNVAGDDIVYFQKCYLACGFEIEDDLSKGLALLVIFALLGQGEGGFAEFAQHSPSEISKMMRRI